MTMPFELTIPIELVWAWILWVSISCGGPQVLALARKAVKAEMEAQGKAEAMTEAKGEIEVAETQDLSDADRLTNHQLSKQHQRGK